MIWQDLQFFGKRHQSAFRLVPAVDLPQAFALFGVYQSVKDYPIQSDRVRKRPYAVGHYFVKRVFIVGGKNFYRFV